VKFPGVRLGEQRSHRNHAGRGITGALPPEERNGRGRGIGSEKMSVYL